MVSTDKGNHTILAFRRPWSYAIISSTSPNAEAKVGLVRTGTANLKQTFTN